MVAFKKGVTTVLDHLKTGKVLGTRGELPRLGAAGGSTALKFRSYNPSLEKSDFVSILPETLFGTPRSVSADRADFQVVKCRDPRYFQFKDYYVLLFDNHKALKEYHKATELGRINKIRVKFVPLPKGDNTERVFAHYVDNLMAAFESRGEYNERARTKKPFDRENFDLKELQERIKPVEERSALVWNLPLAMKSHDVMDKFWFYDIKHCFKLYWDMATGSTLYYIAFNDTDDCLKFKRNYHGVYFDDELHMKLLVETLG